MVISIRLAAGGAHRSQFTREAGRSVPILPPGDSQWDELGSILPVEKILGGYYREVGTTFNGGTLVADLGSNPSI
ncbi:MAG: hypothetical protein ACKO2M_02160 [Actinomycetota bacterium]